MYLQDIFLKSIDFSKLGTFVDMFRETVSVDKVGNFIQIPNQLVQNNIN